MKAPLAKKPIGPTKLGSGFGGYWNNWHRRVDGPVTCEFCGTTHPERKDETYIINLFLGYEVVEECCGALIDLVYEESGKEFAIAFLEEFAHNPTSPHFSILLTTLNEICIKAQKTALETAKQLYVDHIKLVSAMEIIKRRS